MAPASCRASESRKSSLSNKEGDQDNDMSEIPRLASWDGIGMCLSGVDAVVGAAATGRAAGRWLLEKQQRMHLAGEQ